MAEAPMSHPIGSNPGPVGPAVSPEHMSESGLEQKSHPAELSPFCQFGES